MINISDTFLIITLTMEFFNTILSSFTGCASTQNTMNQNYEMLPVATPIAPPNNQLVIRIDNYASKKIIIYCRVSTKEQDLAVQQHACEQYCIANGYQIVNIVTEKCSGYRSRQVKLLQLLRNNRDVNLLVFAVDRFSRSSTTCDRFIQLMELNNINLLSLKEDITLRTALGKHNFRQIVSAAQYESELIGERIRSNIRYKLENGLHVGRAPYGYTLNRQTKKLESVPSEQAVIRFILSCIGREKRLSVFNDQLRDLIRTLNLPDYEFVPMEISEEDRNYSYGTLNPDEKVQITKTILCDLLNDYEILNRGRQWTKLKIHNIANNGLKNFSNLSL